MTSLRRRMSEDMCVRNLSACTRDNYIRAVQRFARHFNRSPEVLGPAEVRSYQVFLATDKRLHPSSINVEVCALRFLYGTTLQRDWNLDRVLPHPKLPASLPVVPSPEEVGQLLACVPHLLHRSVLTVCYAAGLRIAEAVSLRPAHIDSQRMLIRIAHGKGGKDRYVMLSPHLLEQLRDYWRRTRPPGEWLFPGSDSSRHISPEAVRAACRDGLRRSGLAKRVTPHSLRHAFAAHLLESGTHVRAIQLLLGHRSIASTSRYLHVAACDVAAVTSPFDRLAAASA